MKPHFDRVFKRNVPLAHYTTFRIGGPASYFCAAQSAEQLAEALYAAFHEGLPWHVIGEGSNILANDDHVNSAIIAYTDDAAPIRNDGGHVIVAGGTSLCTLVEYCSQRGLGGLETLVDIPGTVGGAIAGNAGAYGATISQRLTSVRLMDRHGTVRNATHDELGFDYRTSALQQSSDVVVEASFKLKPSTRSDVEGRLFECRTDRYAKHPDYHTTPTAGSFFKNLPPPPGGTRRQAAGQYLEEVGAKDLRVGDAGLWHKHANIVVNHGRATARDVKKLTFEMAHRVHDRFGIILEPEVQFLG